MSIEERDRKIINRLTTDDAANSRSPALYTRWPYHFLYSLNGLKLWQSFLNYTTRLTSYPIQAINV
jgi:hypothetical protein